jgi:hypothetical protein
MHLPIGCMVKYHTGANEANTGRESEGMASRDPMMQKKSAVV